MTTNHKGICTQDQKWKDKRYAQINEVHNKYSLAGRRNHGGRWRMPKHSRLEEEITYSLHQGACRKQKHSKSEDKQLYPCPSRRDMSSFKETVATVCEQEDHGTIRHRGAKYSKHLHFYLQDGWVDEAVQRRACIWEEHWLISHSARAAVER